MIGSLKEDLNSILEIRTMVGADLKKVYLVTRTWSGEAVGDGSFTDQIIEVTPTPGIKDLSHQARVLESGGVKQGDILVHAISKQTFPLESGIDCSGTAANVEKLYKVGEHRYRVIGVIERHLTWEVHVRRMTDQRGS